MVSKEERDVELQLIILGSLFLTYHSTSNGSEANIYSGMRWN